jgi:predicted HAD superfamily Cof-like phosphohydrolase
VSKKENRKQNKMKQIQQDVREFMLACGQACPEKPTVPSWQVRRLRARLILEEAIEQCESLGFTLRGFNLENLESNLTEADLIEAADGIADQIYVSLGTAIALGIDMQPIWDLVHKANMAKFGPGSYKKDGKQMKPPGWAAPHKAIEEEIIRQQSKSYDSSSTSQS